MSRVGALAVRKTLERTYDPTAGVSQREVWQGDPLTLRNMAAMYKATKVRCILTEDSGIATLSTDPTPSVDSSGEVPADRYEFSSEMVHESLWNSPWVYQYAVAYNAEHTSDGYTAEDRIAEWKDECENYLKDGTNGGPKRPSLTGLAEPVLSIYKTLLTFGEHYERERVVLMRTRVISQKFAQRLQPNELPTVYKTAGLIRVYSIPSEVQNLMPTEPASNTYSGTDKTWAWKQRRQTSSIVRFTNKVEEVQDWVFDAWPNVLFQIITT